MKSADVPLSSWFAKQKGATTGALDLAALSNDISVLRLSLHRADLERVFTGTLELLALPSSERPPERCLDIMLQWAACRSPKATAAVGAVLVERLAQLSPESVFPALPDVALVEAWRKTAGLAAPDLVARVLRAADYTFPLPVFDWALHSHPAEQQSAPLRLLLERLDTREAADLAARRLDAFVAKDPKAQHLALLLGLLADAPSRLERVATTIREATAALPAVLDNISKLADGKHDSLPLAATINALFHPMLESTGKKRTRACGLLARLGGDLLLVEKRGQAGEDALSATVALGEQFRSTARDADKARDTWFLASASQPAPAAGDMISNEGALRWAFAYEECQQSGVPIGPLESLGRNLGVRPITEPGAVMPFEPRWHEDRRGGLLPGDSVRAVTSGWQFQNRPLIRAHVQPA